MQHVEKCIEVNAPVSMVYNQWTQFEEFPRFMEGVESVEQVDDKRLHWKAEIAGKKLEWDAEIFEQIPDRRIAWRSMTGPLNTGMANFEPLGPNQTRVHLKINFDPEGALENIGSALGVVGARVQGDLNRFKEFIESRGSETGAWRGRIEGRNVEPAENMGSSAESMPRSQRLRGTPETGSNIEGHRTREGLPTEL